LIAAWKSHQLGKILLFENFAYTGQKIYQARGSPLCSKGLPPPYSFQKIEGDDVDS
jgi:hypothetical protein